MNPQFNGCTAICYAKLPYDAIQRATYTREKIEEGYFIENDVVPKLFISHIRYGALRSPCRSFGIFL
jgi:hypothetical protein